MTPRPMKMISIMTMPPEERARCICSASCMEASCFAIHMSAEYTSRAKRTTPEVDMPLYSVRVLFTTVRQ